MTQTEGHTIEFFEDFAKDLIRKAGSEALTFYGKGDSQVRFDNELVTKAELHLIEFFQDRLAEAFPHHQVFSNTLEETDYTHEEKRYLWVYDVIDGVSNYQAGVPMWGISLALQENFWPVFGLIYMPATGELFYARAGEKLFAHGQSTQYSGHMDQITDESVLYIFSRFHQHFHCDFPGKLLNLGCTCVHLCYVAKGRADGAIIQNESFQSLAAARVITEASGAKFFDLSGKEIFLNEYLEGQKIDSPLIVTTPDLFPQIRNHIQEVRT